MERLRLSWQPVLLLIFIGCLYLSYYPLVTFGMQDGIHLDGSLLYVIAVFAVLSSLSAIWKRREQLWHDKAWLILIVFSLYVTLSTLWSPNPLRAVLTAAFLWLVVGASTAIAVSVPALIKRGDVVQRILFGGLLASCGWALWQVIGDAVGVSPTYTLLPEAYTSAVFGVARPTAFALEPQFLASLLLAPFGWFFYMTLTKPPKLLSAFALMLTTSMLFLTMSRGGLLAASAIGVILAVMFIRHHWRNSLPVFAALGGGAIMALALMFVVASLNSRDAITGSDAVARSLNHLSLGTLRLPEKSASPAAKNQSADGTNKKTANTDNGYIKSSTTSRLSMSQKALSVWSAQPGTILFGVGIGGFGKTLHEADPAQAIDSVVNNYFLEMLAELGVIGFGLFAASIGYLLYRLVIRRYALLFALIVGFLVQWCFFSGNANVIHVWALLGAALAVSAPSYKQRLLQ